MQSQRDHPLSAPSGEQSLITRPEQIHVSLVARQATSRGLSRFQQLRTWDAAVIIPPPRVHSGELHRGPRRLDKEESGRLVGLGIQDLHEQLPAVADLPPAVSVGEEYFRVDDDAFGEDYDQNLRMIDAESLPPLQPVKALYISPRNFDGIPCSTSQPVSYASLSNSPMASSSPSLASFSPILSTSPTLNQDYSANSAPSTPLASQSTSFAFGNASNDRQASSPFTESLPIVASTIAGGLVIILGAVIFMLVRKRVTTAKCRAEALTTFEPDSWLDNEKKKLKGIVISTPPLSSTKPQVFPDALGVVRGPGTKFSRFTEQLSDASETYSSSSQSESSYDHSRPRAPTPRRASRHYDLHRLSGTPATLASPILDADLDLPETPIIERKPRPKSRHSFVEPPSILVTDHPQDLAPPRSPPAPASPCRETSPAGALVNSISMTSKFIGPDQTSPKSFFGSVNRRIAPPRPVRAASRHTITSTPGQSVAKQSVQITNSLKKHRKSREWEEACARVRARKGLDQPL